MQHIIPDFVTESVHCSTIVENDCWYSICVSHQHISKLACDGCIIILSSGHNKPVCPWKSVLQSYYIVLLHSKLQFAFPRKRTIVWFFSLPLLSCLHLFLRSVYSDFKAANHLFCVVFSPSRLLLESPPTATLVRDTFSPLAERTALHCTQVYV